MSDAKRTRETWELVSAVLPEDEGEVPALALSLYGRDADGTAERAGDDRVMLVGHNPGLHELASRLAHRNNALETRLRAKFPTAAGAIFTRKDKDSAWKLKAYVTPKTVSD